MGAQYALKYRNQSRVSLETEGRPSGNALSTVKRSCGKQRPKQRRVTNEILSMANYCVNKDSR